jgi:glycosidase
MKTFIQTILLLTIVVNLSAQKTIDRIEPPFWWTGMKNTEVQLMVYGNKIAESEVTVNYDNVVVKSVDRVKNSNYLFLNLEIRKDAKPGGIEIVFKKGKKKIKHHYELKEKSERTRGFSSSDLIYLAMPDRFANGDPTNDNHKDMLEKADRENPLGRHGGDIKGVIDRLGYLKDMGITALWLNPTLENNQPKYSYHGYAITDFYNTDPRYGTNEDYKRLADELHKRDMKLIMDMIFNHCGSNHWWMKDMPADDWANTGPDYRSNFRGSSIADIHASEYDRKKMTQGWFDNHMPDMNQHNPFLAKYLIQNSIWWIEYADLDGIRMDTYPYPFKDFMAEWAKAVHEEYPDFTLLGETWLQRPAFTAYFSGNNSISGDFESGLNSTTDFPLYYATKKAFNDGDGWTSGLSSIYYILAQDFLYGNAYNNVIFLDNHDLDRYFSSVGKDLKKLKMGIGFLLTTRGIPMIYYGTEILSTGLEHEGHGHIRKDFPGGWEKDEVNAFTKDGRTKEQNEIFEYISKLAKWRKTSKAVTKGKLTHFAVDNNIYVYLRHTEGEAVMVIINNSDEHSRTLESFKYEEILKDYVMGKDIISGKSYNLKKIIINSKSILILELSN